MKLAVLVSNRSNYRRAEEKISIFTVPESRITKGEEPWSPALLYIDKVLDHKNIYIAPWSKRQIRFLSLTTSLLLVMERYVKIPHAWIKALIHEYMSLSKYENGRLLKSAESVARAQASRTFMQLSRLKRIFVGEE